MDDEQNGTQEGAQNVQEQGQRQAQQAVTQQVVGDNEAGNAPVPDFERQIAERDEKIASLEARIAEAAKSAEKAEKLSAEIAELKQASAEERVDFSLQLARCRNVKAARAALRKDRPAQRGGRDRRGQDAQALARHRGARRRRQEGIGWAYRREAR